VCDGADNDCDGVVPTDEADGDSDGSRVCDGDCDDFDPTAYPGAPETCDGVDDDCDGTVDDGLTIDADGDGYSSIGSCGGTGDDCVDANPALLLVVGVRRRRVRRELLGPYGRTWGP
jgi:hypothetical protein